MTHTVKHFYQREDPVSSQGIEFADGVIAGASVEYKFGFSEVVGTSEATIWPHNSLYVFPPAAVTMNVSSTSNTDQAAGGGASTIFIEGLDVSFEPISEIVSITGNTISSTTQEFLRVNRAYITAAGANATNDGDVYVGTGAATLGVPDVFYANVETGEGQTLQSIFTVANNKSAFITSVTATSGKGVNNATFRFKQRNENGVFRLLDKFVLLRNDLTIPHSPPVKIEEKTDLMATAVANADVVVTSFVWTMILFDTEI